MIVKIFCGPANYDLKKLYKKDDNEFLVGVDKGAIIAIEMGFTLDLALGDFDSVTAEELQTIHLHSKEVETHNKMKDFTDSFLAVKKALEMNATDIILYGAIGGRLDHTYANLNLLKLGNISIVNNSTRTFMLDPGTYHIDNEYDYISFFSIEDVEELSLSGFTYEVDEINLSIDNPLCISNHGSGIITFSKGLLLVVQQNE